MKSELIVDVQPGEVSIALLEDSRLVSLQKESRTQAYAVGDIYIAKIKKLMPGLNAAFVNVGYEKDGFLHYLDLGPHFASYKEFMNNLMGDRRHIPSLSKMDILPDIDKHGTITEQLQPGQELMVQIVKEPISSKGPRLTTELSFTGRYMVLIPFNDKISVSQKIKTTEEKLRLRQLISSIKPKNFGVIIRTSAEGKRVAELINEMKALLQCWEETCAKCQKLQIPSLVFEEESRTVGMLRDVFSPSFESIYVNDEEIGRQIKNYVSLIAPDSKDVVKLYDKPEPIFDTFGITRQIKTSFGKTVSFKSGAYIIIEHTEALHVIDVNSGNRTKAGMDQETNALDVNLRAADEIARQLRLRDMGGIIVIDFIDMAQNEHRQQLYEHMKEVMANDRARHNILPLSKFGLMQITRQRVRPALDIVTEESCPSCNGKGKIQSSLLYTDQLFEKLEYVCNELDLSNFTLYVHPYVEAYVKKGWLMSLSAKWKRQLGHNFRIVADQSLAYLDYKIKDKEGHFIDVKEIKEHAESKNHTKKLAEEVEEIADSKTASDAGKGSKGDGPKKPAETKPSPSGRKARQKQRQNAMRELAAAENQNKQNAEEKFEAEKTNPLAKPTTKKSKENLLKEIAADTQQPAGQIPAADDKKSSENSLETATTASDRNQQKAEKDRKTSTRKKAQPKQARKTRKPAVESTSANDKPEAPAERPESAENPVENPVEKQS